MNVLDTLPEGPVADAIQALLLRVEETELFVAELADEMGSRLADNREFLKQRKLCESLLTQAFGLASAEALYWQAEMSGRRMINYPLGSVGPSPAARTAQLILSYLLFVHCANASLREIERIYGYNRNRVSEYMSRLELNDHDSALRRRVERAFLDGMGRADEPVSEFDPFNFRRVTDTKNWCREHGVAYRYSLVNASQ